MKDWEVSIIQATTPQDFAAAGHFILDYSREFKESLAFQDIETEVLELEKRYCPPHARLFLLTIGGVEAGCVIVQKRSDDTAEMKRMYIAPPHRGKGYSQVMLDVAIGTARNMGAKKLLLDTEPAMTSAIHLYEKNGFRPIPPYYDSPLPDAMFYELKL